MSVFTPPSVQSKRLAVALLSTDTSFVLEDILSWDNVNDLTPASFGTGNPPYALGALRSADNTQIEFFWFNPANIASASIPFGARGLSYSGGLTGGVTTPLAWPAYTTLVELGSNVPLLFTLIGFLGNDQAWTGANQFTQNPTKGAATLAATNDSYVTKYDLINAALGQLNTNQVIVGGVSDAALTAGKVVYFKTSNQRWAISDQATSSTYTQVILGIVQNTVASSGLAVNVLLYGEDANQSGMTPGSFYYLGTAGAIAATAGATYEVSVGVAKSATVLEFSPLQKYEASSGMYAAMAGDDASIAIGTGNKVVTQTGLQIGAEVSGTLGGTGTAYTFTASPVPAALTTGLEFSLIVNTVNTGAATFTLNALAAKAIKKYGTQALVAGDMAAGQACRLKYDGTQWQLLNPATAPGVPPQTASYLLSLYYGTATGFTTTYQFGGGVNGLAGQIYSGAVNNTSLQKNASVNGQYTYLTLDSVANVPVIYASLWSGGNATLPTSSVVYSPVLFTGTSSYIFGNNSGAYSGSYYPSGVYSSAVTFSNSPPAPTSGKLPQAFTDGTYIYIAQTDATFSKFSVSGATLTYVATVTYTGMSANQWPWSDGTSVYGFTSSGIAKWALAGGAATQYTGVTPQQAIAGQSYVVGVSQTSPWLAVVVVWVPTATSTTEISTVLETIIYIPKF